MGGGVGDPASGSGSRRGGRAQEVRTFPTFTSGAGGAGWVAGRRGGGPGGDGGHRPAAGSPSGRCWKRRAWSCCWSTPATTRILPGRKTDVCDAAWLAELLEHGLLRGSFVPPPAIRELRDLTRYRKRIIQAHASEGQRVQKTLEDAGSKQGLGRR
jgi:hypothetical protein